MANIDNLIKVNGVSFPIGTTVVYSLVNITANENTLESGYVEYDFKRSVVKVTINFDNILGSELNAVLGKSWYLNQGNSNFTYDCVITMPDDSTVTGKFYFTTSDITLDTWDDNANNRIYTGFSITWIQK